MILQKNPLTMVGLIDRCWLFTFQTPQEEAVRHLPRPLKPLTHRGFAFWNVVVCHIEGMRPKGLPKAVGVSYWHVGYRLYVRFPAVNGEDIQGLYFVRSDCDSAVLSAAGNLMTDFNFHTAPVQVEEAAGHTASSHSRYKDVRIDIGSHDAPAHAVIQPGLPPSLPPYSAFDHLDQAARFLKYKPFGISVERSNGRFSAHPTANVVRIVRNERAWQARCVKVSTATWSFLADKNVRPEICYEVDPIEYQWNRGYRVQPRLQDAHGEEREAGNRCGVALLD